MPAGSGHPTKTIPGVVILDDTVLSINLNDALSVGDHHHTPLAGVHVAPNPFRAGRGVTIHFEDAWGSGNVQISVYDLTGRLVRNLGGRTGDEGRAVWDSYDQLGRQVAPGMYFIRLDGAHQRSVARVVKLP